MACLPSNPEQLTWHFQILEDSEGHVPQETHRILAVEEIQPVTQLLPQISIS